MYNPSHFQETRAEVLHALIRKHPLATLVGVAADGLEANHVPLYLRQNEGGTLSLVGHVARANPVWKSLDLQVPVLAIFQGPQHYISPGWYATKPEGGKVVPTWNYATVHVRGSLLVHDDAQWIHEQMAQLTSQQEAPQAHPWQVSDAPSDYVEKLVAAVVGIEIPIASIEGKWKVSQNQPAINQSSVVDALKGLATDEADAMAAAVQAVGQHQG